MDLLMNTRLAQLKVRYTGEGFIPERSCFSSACLPPCRGGSQRDGLSHQLEDFLGVAGLLGGACGGRRRRSAPAYWTARTRSRAQISAQPYSCFADGEQTRILVMSGAAFTC